MRYIFFFIALIFIIPNTYGKYRCDSVKFKKLIRLSSKKLIDDNEFQQAITLVKYLDNNKCRDYVRGDSEIASLTDLLAEICLKNNSHEAAKEYINYIHRHHGSAEEAISFGFEKLFVEQPDYILSIIGFNKDLLNELEWGFVNNHYHIKNNGHILQLNSNNYKTIFYQVNPKIKTIYPKYKNQIDYLLNEIHAELE